MLNLEPLVADAIRQHGLEARVELAIVAGLDFHRGRLLWTVWSSSRF
jgi:hypothetical protein